MRKHYLSLLFLFSLCLGFAQTKDSLSIEEQARREKNIQAGNPFKKFGYTPKIATLSKGKYLEFHDLDSIVQVGTFMYNTRSKSVVSIIEKDTLPPSEATLQPEIISRWMSPDPLADEFPEWSPYNFVMNNPLRYVDPLGLAPEDILSPDKIKPTFESPAAQAQTNEVVLGATGGAYGTTINMEGNLELQSTGQAGPLTEGQQAFVDKFNAVADAPQTIEISISQNNENTLVGNFDTGDIDIADVAKYGDGPYETAGGAIAQELTEQYDKQTGGSQTHTSSIHNKAVREGQNPVNGRWNGGIDGNRTKFANNSGVITTRSYNNAGQNVKYVKTTIVNNNIIKVEQ